MSRIKQISLDIQVDDNEKETILKDVERFINEQGYMVIGSDESDVTDLYKGFSGN